MMNLTDEGTYAAAMERWQPPADLWILEPLDESWVTAEAGAMTAEVRAFVVQFSQPCGDCGGLIRAGQEALGRKKARGWDIWHVGCGPVESSEAGPFDRAPRGGSDDLALLTRLSRLHTRGVISEAEFTAKKADILTRI